MKILTDMTPTAATQEIIYNSEDTMKTMALKELYDEGLLPDWAQPGLRYSELMLGPIMTMMRRGVQIDTVKRDRIVEGLRARAATVQANFDYVCEKLWATTVNHNSNPQLKTLLYDFLAIPEQTKSKKGETKVAADREVLERIARDYPRGAFFANHILRIRDLEKQVEFLTKKLSPSNRFHCSYNLGGTENFRLSSSEHPLRIGSNGQNINPLTRGSFIADPGYLMFYSDQQSAESRLVAYLSGDENYIAAVEGGDTHTLVASMVFGFDPVRELADRQFYRDFSYRDIAKRAGHACNYYAKPYTIAKNAMVDLEIAEQFQALYFRKFSKISDWHVWIAKNLQQVGHLVNPFGVRRTFWSRRWDDATLREAIAFGPQSTVGMLTNLGLYQLWERFEGKPGADVQILGNIHDAVIGQVREDKVAELIPEILDCLHFPFEVTDISGKTRQVLIPYEIETGRNFGKGGPDNLDGLKKWKFPKK
jgi:DNA polymerase I-like protein with 3'-5' exonuclease and polymerase domains